MLSSSSKKSIAPSPSGRGLGWGLQPLSFQSINSNIVTPWLL